MKAHARYPTTPGSSHGRSHSHSRTSSHSHCHGHSKTSTTSTTTTTKPSKSTSPAASPRPPYSVGQNHPPGQPPKLSPGCPSDARSSSPNYFGLLVDPSTDPRDSSGLPTQAWGSSPSSIKSFGAAIPKQVQPLDGNPDFEAFRRQADLNRGKPPSLSFAAASHQGQPLPSPSLNPAPARPRPSRWHTHGSDTSDSPFGRAGARDGASSRMDIDRDSFHDSAYVSSESNRNSESSLLPNPSFLGQIRYESPRPMDPPQHPRSNLTRAEDRDPRLSVMVHKADPPSPHLTEISRAATLPTSLDNTQPTMMSSTELKDMMDAADDDNVLLLDIRSSQNYALSRINGALNLCIPTTLLKRATFNIHKLQQTFQQGSESEKFSNWRNMVCIIVYDSHSSDKRDAVTAQNMIKKFTNEGYDGKTCILRGGFTAFQDRFPECVDKRSMAEIAGRSGKSGPGGGLAPVIGGVNLPNIGNSLNPFFSNIRQNMDLADGVGQFEITKPSGFDPTALPQWLRDAADPSDHGKKVSDKFLHIERTEQSRMRTAYSAFDNGSASTVQLCGVEKGGKNRYKDILPFEHARVRLQNKPAGDCDYVNASHLKSSRSHKRYIASQGPLPATFEDFWSVIWEQDVRVIVMLTAESEGGQLKCHPYWKGRDFGLIRLKLLSEKKASLDIDKHRADSNMTPSSQFSESGRRRANTTTSLESSTPTPQSLLGQSETPHVIIRKFALSHAAYPFAPMREITHLHFPAWPDFGTPAQPSHLLALVELSNLTQRAALPVETASVVGSRKSSTTDSLSMTWFDEPEPDTRSRPMLVHCSAGCGRTGTFCTVDSVLDMLKRRRQAQAGASRSVPTRDAQGDIDMMDGDEPVSPMTTSTTAKPMTFQALPPRRFMPDQAGASGSPLPAPASPLDTSWLDNESVDLIAQTVEDFREQRLSMVQSLRQFVLCYETVLEWVHRVNDRAATSITGRSRSGSMLLGSRRE